MTTVAPRQLVKPILSVVLGVTKVHPEKPPKRPPPTPTPAAPAPPPPAPPPNTTPSPPGTTPVENQPPVVVAPSATTQGGNNQPNPGSPAPTQIVQPVNAPDAGPTGTPGTSPGSLADASGVVGLQNATTLTAGSPNQTVTLLQSVAAQFQSGSVAGAEGTAVGGLPGVNAPTGILTGSTATGGGSSSTNTSSTLNRNSNKIKIIIPAVVIPIIIILLAGLCLLRRRRAHQRRSLRKSQMSPYLSIEPRTIQIGQDYTSSLEKAVPPSPSYTTTNSNLDSDSVARQTRMARWSGLHQLESQTSRSTGAAPDLGPLTLSELEQSRMVLGNGEDMGVVVVASPGRQLITPEITPAAGDLSFDASSGQILLEWRSDLAFRRESREGVSNTSRRATLMETDSNHITLLREEVERLRAVLRDGSQRASVDVGDVDIDLLDEGSELDGPPAYASQEGVSVMVMEKQ